MGEFEISLIIPAYNEERRIKNSLTTMQAFMAQQPYSAEVILVNDGSVDNTGAVIAQLIEGRENFRLLESSPNRGKGYAVRQGILAAKGKVVGFLDADLSTPISEINSVLNWLETHPEYDGVIGSRGLPESHIEVSQPLPRQIAAKLFKLMVRVCYGLWEYHDTQCGFKFFRGEVAREIFSRQKVDGFPFDIELLCLAKKMGYRLYEMPITWANDPDSRLHLARDAGKIVRDLIRIQFNRLRGLKETPLEKRTEIPKAR
ncbi:MAG: glycosyltransferase family 2 protein [Candidatus Tectomicrobia bacterium]|nr:glycosyltransferase family 2 protein [Candidatus Tectomicrobia bacterium]